MQSPARRHIPALALLGALLATGGPVAAMVEESATRIVDGAAIYQENCATCHRRGKAGAPVIAEAADWAPRLTKGRELLIKHALKGYSGPAGDEMPARGGNDDLTDAEVTAAVDHILSQVQPPLNP